MAQLHVTLQLFNADWREQILPLLQVPNVCLDELGDEQHWYDPQPLSNADLLVVDATRLDATDADRLLRSETLLGKQIVFLSNGLPNAALDTLLPNCAGVLFRTPFDPILMQEVIADAIAVHALQTTSNSVGSKSELDQFGMLVGSSEPMRELYRTIRRVAATEQSVLIIGESGVGKELVASTLHNFSERAQAPFIAVNCGALASELVESELFGHRKGAFTGAISDHKGLFEQAEGGTLFLDEVTEMPLAHQVKLLRTLETGEYRPLGASKVQIANVRLIAATNREPETAIEEEVLRADLYFRLAQFPLPVPTLRERKGDVIGLAQHFLANRNGQEQLAKLFSPQALAAIAAYSWPGNVRELKHCIERAYILADKLIDVEHLNFTLNGAEATADQLAPGIPVGLPLDQLEKQAILQTLDENQGNKAASAKQLGISLKTLYNKLERYAE